MSEDTRSLQELLLLAATKLQQNENRPSQQETEAALAEKDQEIQDQAAQLAELQRKYNEVLREKERILTEKDDVIWRQEIHIKQIEDALKKRQQEYDGMKITLGKALEGEKAARMEKAHALDLKEQYATKILQLENEIEEQKVYFQELLKTNVNLRAQSLIWKALARISSRTTVQLQDSSKRTVRELEEKTRLNEMLQSVLKEALDNASDRDTALLKKTEEFYSQNAALQQQLEERATMCAELEREASSLRTEYETSQNKVQEVNLENERLEEEKQQLEAASQEFLQQATLYRQETENRESVIKVLETKEAAAKELMTETGKQIVTLQLHLTKAESTVKNLNTEIHTKSTQLREFKTLVEELKEQRLHQEFDLQKARSTIANLENKVEILEADIQKLTETLAAKQEEIQNGAEAYMDISNKNYRLHTELNQKNEEIRRYILEADRARMDARGASRQNALWTDDERRNQTL